MRLRWSSQVFGFLIKLSVLITLLSGTALATVAVNEVPFPATGVQSTDLDFSLVLPGLNPVSDSQNGTTQFLSETADVLSSDVTLADPPSFVSNAANAGPPKA